MQGCHRHRNEYSYLHNARNCWDVCFRVPLGRFCFTAEYGIVRVDHRPPTVTATGSTCPVPATMATLLAGGRTLLVVKPVLRGTSDTEPGVLGSPLDAVSCPGDGQATNISGSASADEFEEVLFYTNELEGRFSQRSPACRRPVWLVWFARGVMMLSVHTPHTHRSTAVTWHQYVQFSERLETNPHQPPRCQLHSSNCNSIINCV